MTMHQQSSRLPYCCTLVAGLARFGRQQVLLVGKVAGLPLDAEALFSAYDFKEDGRIDLEEYATLTSK